MGLAALALLAPAAAGAATQPRFEEYSNRYELGNEEISVTFEEKKPLLNVSTASPAGNETRSYPFHMLRVAEYQDQDGDRAYDENETAAVVDLAGVPAEDYDVRAQADGDAVHVTMNLNTTIEPRATTGDPTDTDVPIGEEPRANLTLRFHLYDGARDLETAGEGIVVEPTEVKFDFEVHRWDWTTDDGRLAFVTEFPAANDTEVQPQNDSSRMSVRQDGTEIGHVGWQNEAQIQTEHGEEPIDVIPTIKKDQSTTDGNGTVLLAWSYDAGAGYDGLLHDPTIGVTPAEEGDAVGLADEVTDVPGPGAALLAAAAIGAARLGGRGRRR